LVLVVGCQNLDEASVDEKLWSMRVVMVK
jgi:hypothetical protein